MDRVFGPVSHLAHLQSVMSEPISSCQDKQIFTSRTGHLSYDPCNQGRNQGHFILTYRFLGRKKHLIKPICGGWLYIFIPNNHFGTSRDKYSTCAWPTCSHYHSQQQFNHNYIKKKEENFEKQEKMTMTVLLKWGCVFILRGKFQKCSRNNEKLPHPPPSFQLG